MDELPFHKVFVDSRAASAGNASSWEVTLPETLSLPRNAVCYVTDVAISHSFLPVDGVGAIGGANDLVYFVEQASAGSDPRLCRAELAEGSYTAEELAAEMATAMTASSWLRSSYSASYIPSLNVIRLVSSDGGFQLVNQDMLRDAAFQDYFSTRSETVAGTFSVFWPSPGDCCGLLGLASGGSKNITFAALQGVMVDVGLPGQGDTGHVDVRRRHAVYLHSQALANLRALGPGGSRTVLARVPVDTTFGAVLAKQHTGHPLDYQVCGGRTLRTLDFSVRDSFNRLVDLRGGHVSFELLFTPKPLI